MADAINSAQAIPNLDKRAEVHTADLSTDANGDGSTTVSWDEAFSGGVFVLVSGDADGDFFASATGNSQATVEVAGSSTTGGTVTATVVAFGDD